MKRLTMMLSLMLVALWAQAQEVRIESGRFQKGDNPAWNAKDFNDSAWQTLSLDKDWGEQGVKQFNGYGWYRIHVVIPSELKQGTMRDILLNMGAIDDTDETWLNGVKVGKTGTNPEDPEGYHGQWNVPRRYIVDPSLIRWDQDNVIAVRVYNANGPGGFFQGAVRVGKPVLSDYVSLSVTKEALSARTVLTSKIKTSGAVTLVKEDVLSGKPLESITRKVKLNSRKPFSLSLPMDGQVRMTVTYCDDRFASAE